MRYLILAAACLLPPCVLRAQAPAPEPPPDAAAPAGAAETQPATESAGEPATDEEPADKPEADAEKGPTCSLAAPCVTADRQGFEKGRFWFTGFVDIRAGNLRVQADEVEIEDRESETGKTRILTASDNVVFLRGPERLAGDRLELDLGSGRGRFEQAAGFLQPGVFIEGRSIERIASDRYHIRGGTFTSCSQPRPRWSFSASSATVKVGRHIRASNVLFRVKGVPALYVPYFYYPIRDDQRSTGFLFPHFGYSSLRGFNIGSGFFWAMGRSADQTFYADHYADFGVGLGHELRYALQPPSAGVFRTFALKPQGGDEWDYDIDWRAQQRLPGNVRMTVNVRRYSNLEFLQSIQEDLDRATTRSQRALIDLRTNWGGTQFRLYADGNDTYFPNDTTRVNRHIPSLQISRSPRRIGRTGVVFGFEARAERLSRGSRGLINTYTRLDVSPVLSRPMGTSYLRLSPRVRLRYTHYGASLEDGQTTGPPLSRPFVESTVELSGPNFSRIFNVAGGYTDKLKHVIGPEVSWRHRTRVEDLQYIPRFDGIDQMLGTHQVTYGLVQRFFIRRPGNNDKPVPRELLAWRVFQTYYANVAESQNEFDPNYSSAVFGPGGRPQHYSPLRSRVQLRPSRSVNANFDLEYDVNFKQLRTLGLSTRLNTKVLSLSGTWSRAKRLAEDPALRRISRDTLRGSAQLALASGRLTLGGSGDYDMVNGKLLRTRAQARFSVQCCGLMVEWLRFDINRRQEQQFRFAVELANIGSMGNFMGQQMGRRQGGGYR